MNLELATTTNPLVLTETTNGPKLWKQIIDQIPGAFVAGGAVLNIDAQIEKRVDRLSNEEIDRRVDAKVNERFAAMRAALT